MQVAQVKQALDTSSVQASNLPNDGAIMLSVSILAAWV